MEKADSWWHGLSPSSRQDRLESALLALKSLEDTGLGATSVLANLHHQWITPLMERELRIFEMDETANPVALARSRLVQDCLPLEYAATRARHAINLKAVRHSNDDLWSFVMLPNAPPRLFPFSFILLPRAAATLTFHSSQQRVTVNAAPSDPPTPRARAHARAAQRREQEQAVCNKERRIRRRERREQRNEEFRLREQQGLSPPATSEYSSSGEEEEEASDRGRAPREVGVCTPLTESRGGGRGASA
jgi:hypothetical protein